MANKTGSPVEYRVLKNPAPRVTEGQNLSGRAIAFNSPTIIGGDKYGFREFVNPAAVTKSVNDGDVVLLDNHDTGKPLARQSAHTLTLVRGKDGLDWDAEPADTTYARDAVANVKAGNYGGCSFGFEVVRDKWTYNADDDMDERELLEIKLREISVVTFPAYGDTSVMAGGRDAVEIGWEARSKFYEKDMREKYNADELEALGKKGHAYLNADGHYSYPVDDAEDLARAIKAVGRGGASHDAIRKFIMARAKAMGKSADIPDNWSADGSLKAESKSGDSGAPQDAGLYLRHQDVIDLAIAIKAAVTQEQRVECIGAATTINAKQMLPPGWNSEGELIRPDKDSRSASQKDMAAIATLIRELPATKASNSILEIAETYLRKSDLDEQRELRAKDAEAEKPGPWSKAEVDRRKEALKNNDRNWRA